MPTSEQHGGDAAKALELSSELQESLRDLARNAVGAPAKRARALLLLASGLPTAQVANRLGVTTATIKYWRGHFEADGVKSLQDGRQRKATPVIVPESVGG